MSNEPNALVVQYAVLRSMRGGRASLVNGMPSWPLDDVSFFDMTLSEGESHTFSTNSICVMELEQPLEVTLEITGNNNAAVTVTRDIGGLIVLPAKTTITVSNPARFAYDTGIGLRVVAG